MCKVWVYQEWCQKDGGCDLNDLTHVQAIKTAGAVNLSVFITHGVFPGESWRKFINGDVQFENIWITDSIPHCRDIAERKPFKLLTLSQMIADSLLGYDLVSEAQ